MPISRCFTSSPNSSSLLGCHHYGILYTNLSLARTITILPPLYLLLCSLPPPSPPLQGSGDQIPTCSNILLCSPLYRVQYLTISHSEYPSMSSVFVLAALSGSCVRLLWSQYYFPSMLSSAFHQHLDVLSQVPLPVYTDTFFSQQFCHLCCEPKDVSADPVQFYIHHTVNNKGETFSLLQLDRKSVV